MLITGVAGGCCGNDDKIDCDGDDDELEGRQD